MDSIDRQQSSQQSQVNPWFQLFIDFMVEFMVSLVAIVGAILLIAAFKSLIKWFFAERSQRESRVESGFQLKSKKKRLKDEGQNSGRTQGNSGRTQENTTKADGVRDP